MIEKSLLDVLENMKKDIYYLSNKLSQINSTLNTNITQKEINELEFDKIDKEQEVLFDEVRKIKKRIYEFESENNNTADFIQDLDSRITKLNKILFEYINKSENNKNSDVLEKIKEVEFHFNTEIKNIYDNVFREILNLKGEINELKQNNKN